MHKYMIKLHYNSIDEINIISLVDKWSKEYTEDFIYYRPKTRDDDISGVANPNDEDDKLYHIPCIRNKNLKKSLLFIHMTMGQRELLKKCHSLFTCTV